MSTTTLTTTYPLRSVSRWEQVKRHLAAWQQRARSRNELEGLSDAALRDIGVTRCDAHRELCKPFWMA